MFGLRLKMLRNDMKLSQEDVGDFLKMDRSSIGKWENESSQPTFETLVQLSNLFDVSTDYLLGKTDIKNPYTDDIDGFQEYSFIQIGFRIKKLREERNMSQKELAKELETTDGLIDLYEKSIRKPGYGTLIRLSSFFNVSTDYLLGLSNLKPSKINVEKLDLINDYSSLSKENKEKLLDYLRLLKLDNYR